MLAKYENSQNQICVSYIKVAPIILSQVTHWPFTSSLATLDT